MKISKLLPISLALLLGMSGAYAASESANANYDLTLPEFFNVVATAPTATTVTFDDNYKVGTITGSLNGSFHVISNTNTKDVYLYGTCLADGGDVPALFSADGKSTGLMLVFTNTGTEGGTAAEATAVEKLRANSKAAEESPNAVVFPLSITPVLKENSYPVGASIQTAESLENTSNVKYTIPNSEVDFNCVVTGTTQNDSLSTLDTNGLYRATLYMSTQAQTL